MISSKSLNASDKPAGSCRPFDGAPFVPWLTLDSVAENEGIESPRSMGAAPVSKSLRNGRRFRVSEGARYTRLALWAMPADQTP